MSPRSFAIVPAAGISVRMGEPKLLLPIAGKPLILHTLAAWRKAGITRVVVVVRPDDAALVHLLRGEDVDVVVPPIAPPDMKASIAFGIEHVAATYRPDDRDVWLVAPADMPGLSPAIVHELLRVAAERPKRILIPTLAGKSGHPVLLPWLLAAQLATLKPDEGLNALIERNNPLLVGCDGFVDRTETAFADIDTPADLARFAEPDHSKP
jgi:molybdenum cofactor cytidylyltransferase